MLSPTSSKASEIRPDFRHVENWIFDLDNTLYRADSDVFAQIDARMAAYIVKKLSLSESEAKLLQKSYYREHGTTLSGLMAVNRIEPEEFLDYVHDIDFSVLNADLSLVKAIDALPGRRFVFTNGCQKYARNILDRLQLTHAFEDVWDIRTTGYRPKPADAAYETVIAKGAFDPKNSAMFEDVARNLVPAHKTGMTTVWLNNNSVWSKQGPEFPTVTPEHIHYQTDDLPTFLHSIRTRQ